MKTILIALGGNALIRDHEIGNYSQQKKNIQKVAEQIAKLSKKYKIVITHGNGPQVGNLQIQMHSTQQVPEMPLEVDVAMTQGQIGFMIQNELKKLLPTTEISTIITEVLVDKKDPAFKNFSKPIGPYLHEKPAFPNLKIEGRGYLKLVASPAPKKIIQLKSIQAILEKNKMVICCGGGGIPVVEKSKNNYEGIEAVIDKDLTSGLLANELNVDEFIILTNVEYAYINYPYVAQIEGKMEKISKIKLHELHHLLERKEFGKGSMEPKVKAAIQFISRGGKKAVITSTAKLLQGIEGKTGTIVTK